MFTILTAVPVEKDPVVTHPEPVTIVVMNQSPDAFNMGHVGQNLHSIVDLWLINPCRFSWVASQLCASSWSYLYTRQPY